MALVAVDSIEVVSVVVASVVVVVCSVVVIVASVVVVVGSVVVVVGPHRTGDLLKEVQFI
jgi:hypothetical protein